VSACEVRVHQYGRLEVRPGEVRPAEVRPAEVLPEEDLEGELRLGEVWTDVGVLVTPRVPALQLEQCDVLVVRHGSTLSATTLFWDGLTMRSIRLAQSARPRTVTRRHARPRWRRSPRAAVGPNENARAEARGRQRNQGDRAQAPAPDCWPQVRHAGRDAL